MSDEVSLEGLNSRQAVEEIAHEIRTRQMSILSLVQLLRKLEAGDVDATRLPKGYDAPQGFDSIQQCVHEISDLLDTLIDFVREDESV